MHLYDILHAEDVNDFLSVELYMSRIVHFGFMHLPEKKIKTLVKV